ncbi:DUF763 domain-containing protein [Geomonas sp. RF6]|uniref:DUF763 domain-containing protein n=1 Tax=Geomonas sp. RF6 TaxID=2897342 RepID=UPI001E2BD746|nr:DUF763 domain-containing protein [Geomonas sp. RF6]UFS71159.1 DUF763 domain-containing protein [Geomonas sp. RF6]
MNGNRRTGYAELPLHGGKAPRWLFERMTRLSREIVRHMVAEYGAREVLRRLSDPFWFQALGCVLGFDWHSSGVTTTTCGALKEGVRGVENELGLFVAGGKGKVSRNTPAEIVARCETQGENPLPLVYASRMSAKVDSAAVQDGFQIYHHSFFFTREGEWAVVQQGMNPGSCTARRYHWLSAGVESFVEEPHAAICCDERVTPLNLVAAESALVREHAVELAVTPDRETMAVAERLPTLVMPQRHDIVPGDINPRQLHKILLQTYEKPPGNFEELLGMKGVGPASLRALALVAEVIFGTPASTRDPARFSFAHGGKDRIPYPVNREVYDTTIEVLSKSLQRAAVPRSEKVEALRRLAHFTEPEDDQITQSLIERKEETE